MLRSVSIRHACAGMLRRSTRHFSDAQLKKISLQSPGFETMRKRDIAFVDKTSAIADFLIDETASSRAILTRPRRFGKSLNLDIMGHMLRAGSLPTDVKPWEDFEPEDTEKLFGGLDVHRRWQAGEPAVKRLLEEAHFVIMLSLGGAMTGAKLGPSIVWKLKRIARYAFGSDVEAAVEKARTTGDALRTLIAAVPRDVPVSVLVDEYDAAILDDVQQRRWVAARKGVAALRSLLVLTTHQHLGARIRFFIAAGVARFHGALAGGRAAGFADTRMHPLVSRMLGLSEAEVRSTFPAELARLGQHARLRAQAELAAAGMRAEDVAGATDAEVGARLLHYWYGGHSFDADGRYSCFNTTPALAALDAGRITDKLLEAARRPYWLGVPAAAVLRGYSDGACDRSEPQLASAQAAGQLRLQEDIADVSTQWTSVHSLSAHRVNARAMLQQVGLLSLTRLGPLPGAATVPAQAEAAPTPEA